MLKVTRGDPTTDELAAVLAVLWAHAARAGSAPMDDDGGALARISPWRRSGLPYPAHRPGPDGWRMSARPR